MVRAKTDIPTIRTARLICRRLCGPRTEEELGRLSVQPAGAHPKRVCDRPKYGNEDEGDRVEHQRPVGRERSIQMNIHKIVLAVLVVVMVAVGTTTVTIHADGPDAGDPPNGGSPEIPEGLVPEEVLTGTDLDNWNALTPEFKAVILEDFILEIPERVPDPSHRVTTLATLVAMMLDMQEQRQREEAAERSGGVAGASQGPAGASAPAEARVRCNFSVRIDSIGALSSLSCSATMANINAYVQVGRRNADTLTGRSNETCWNCSSEWARVYDSPPNPCHRRHAHGTGTPYGRTGGPYPEFHTYSGEYDTYC